MMYWSNVNHSSVWYALWAKLDGMYTRSVRSLNCNMKLKRVCHSMCSWRSFAGPVAFPSAVDPEGPECSRAPCSCVCIRVCFLLYLWSMNESKTKNKVKKHALCTAQSALFFSFSPFTFIYVRWDKKANRIIKNLKIKHWNKSPDVAQGLSTASCVNSFLFHFCWIALPLPSPFKRALKKGKHDRASAFVTR